MKRLIVALLFLSILGSPVLAMEEMSTTELKKITAQIASSVGVVAGASSPAGEIYELGSNLVERYEHNDNLTTAVGPVGVAQTAAEPTGTVINITNDANGFKSGVTFGFF